ncbi:MAG TPA: DNA-binding protein, partial [Anaerolineae bacterium]|nr:DNA-binding protein [Anaerolineae bacterium]
MSRAITNLFIVIIVMALLAAPAYAISSTELIKNAKEYEHTRVSFEGEAVGDIMKRGSYGWINIHDG